jgi:hypothetical protein
MQIQSVKGYDPPKIASFYTVNIPHGSSVEVVAGDNGDISISLGSDPYVVDLNKLLLTFPVIREKRFWILEKRLACLFYPDWDAPLFLNKNGKKFCLLCNSKNIFHEILEEMVKANAQYDHKKVADDSIRFLFLLKSLKLLSAKKGNRS